MRLNIHTSRPELCFAFAGELLAAARSDWTVAMTDRGSQLEAKLRSDRPPAMVVALAATVADLEELARALHLFDGVLIVVLDPESTAELVAMAYQLEPRAVLRNTAAERQLLLNLLAHYAKQLDSHPGTEGQ